MSVIMMFRATRTEFAATCRAFCRGYCTAQEKAREKVVHPYRRIHPWKSEDEFVYSLTKNVLYNADGIVAINKPYGISSYSNNRESNSVSVKTCHKIVGAVNYSLQSILPQLAKELDVPNLIPVTGTEKYMTGVYIFGTNAKAEKDLEMALTRSSHMKKYKKYWCVTTRVPNVLKGQYHLGMKLEQGGNGHKRPVILTNWRINSVKRREVKILNLNYKLISNSTHNLSSLIELDTSTKKWHSPRLFAATMLYSPILGDNYHGSRVQNLMGTWIKVNPFAESCDEMPFVDQELLRLLDIRKSEQEIIPCHIHLKNVYLKSYGATKKDISIDAPLIDPFDWTCRQLMFKNISHEMDYNIETAEEKDQTACV